MTACEEVIKQAAKRIAEEHYLAEKKIAEERYLADRLDKFRCAALTGLLARTDISSFATAAKHAEIMARTMLAAANAQPPEDLFQEEIK